MSRTFWKIRKIKSALDLSYVIDSPPITRLSVYDFYELLEDNRVSVYEEVKVKTPFLIRLTLLFFVVVFIVLFLFMPLKYIIDGKWGYQNEFLRNWSQSLGL